MALSGTAMEHAVTMAIPDVEIFMAFICSQYWYGLFVRQMASSSWFERWGV